MKKIVLALALVLTSSIVVGLASIDANAGARKICKQGLETHPMAGEHRCSDEAVQSTIQSSQEGRSHSSSDLGSIVVMQPLQVMRA